MQRDWLHSALPHISVQSESVANAEVLPVEYSS